MTNDMFDEAGCRARWHESADRKAALQAAYEKAASEYFAACIDARSTHAKHMAAAHQNTGMRRLEAAERASGRRVIGWECPVEESEFMKAHALVLGQNGAFHFQGMPVSFVVDTRSSRTLALSEFVGSIHPVLEATGDSDRAPVPTEVP